MFNHKSSSASSIATLLSGNNDKSAALFWSLLFVASNIILSFLLRVVTQFADFYVFICFSQCAVTVVLLLVGTHAINVFHVKPLQKQHMVWFAIVAVMSFLTLFTAVWAMPYASSPFMLAARHLATLLVFFGESALFSSSASVIASRILKFCALAAFAGAFGYGLLEVRYTTPLPARAAAPRILLAHVRFLSVWCALCHRCVFSRRVLKTARVHTGNGDVRGRRGVAAAVCGQQRLRAARGEVRVCLHGADGRGLPALPLARQVARAPRLRSRLQRVPAEPSARLLRAGLRSSPRAARSPPRRWYDRCCARAAATDDTQLLQYIRLSALSRLIF
jgi:hypothetical protein